MKFLVGRNFSQRPKIWSLLADFFFTDISIFCLHTAIVRFPEKIFLSHLRCDDLGTDLHAPPNRGIVPLDQLSVHAVRCYARILSHTERWFTTPCCYRTIPQSHPAHIPQNPRDQRASCHGNHSGLGFILPPVSHSSRHHEF